MAFSKILILLALCVLPALLVEADRPEEYPYHVKGRVFCDTCHLGCEHKLVTYVEGAEVKIECYGDQTDDLKYSRTGFTDKDGRYVIEVKDDHKDDRCFVVLVSSPDAECNTIVEGRDKVTAVVTNENGVVSHERNANSLGFKKATKIDGCPKLVDLYNSDQGRPLGKVTKTLSWATKIVGQHIRLRTKGFNSNKENGAAKNQPLKGKRGRMK